MKNMTYIDEELERRKSRVGGFKRFVSAVKEQSPVVARSVLRGSKKAGQGVVSAVVAVADTYDSIQDYRLKKFEKQAKIAKAKNKRDRLMKKVGRDRLSF